MLMWTFVGNQLRVVTLASALVFGMCACTINLPGAGQAASSSTAASPTTVDPPTTNTANREPKNLAAATAAAQEKNDRHASGDFAGEWFLFTNQLRNGITQNDFVEFSETCAKIGPPIKATGVRMEGEDTAIVRLEIFGIMKARTMAYEDNQWRMVPDEFLTANLGKTGKQLIAANKAEGGCTT